MALESDGIKSKADEPSPAGDMEAVRTALDRAKEYGLELEVITWAIYHAQSNPEASFSECMQVGLDEWDV